MLSSPRGNKAGRPKGPLERCIPVLRGSNFLLFIIPIFTMTISVLHLRSSFENNVPPPTVTNSSEENQRNNGGIGSIRASIAPERFPTTPPLDSTSDDENRNDEPSTDRDPSSHESNGLHENTTGAVLTKPEIELIDSDQGSDDDVEPINALEEPREHRDVSEPDEATGNSNSNDSPQEIITTSEASNDGMTTHAVASNETGTQVQNVTKEGPNLQNSTSTESNATTEVPPLAVDDTDAPSELHIQNSTSVESNATTEAPTLAVNDTAPPSVAPEESSEWTNATTILDSYDPSLHPVMETKPSSSKPIFVRMLGHILPEKGTALRALAGGLRRSKYLLPKSLSALGPNSQIGHEEIELGESSSSSSKSSRAVLLLVDFSGLDNDCHSAALLVDYALALDENPRERKVLLVDSSGSWEVDGCPAVEKLVGKENLRFTKRNVVRDRYWDDETQWVVTGSIVGPNVGATISGGPVLHMPQMLRETFVYKVDAAMKKRSATRPFDGKKETEVAHFWKRGSNSHYTMLRHKVSEIVAKLEGTSVGSREVHTNVGGIGEDILRELNLIDDEYVEEMLSSKIIVVAQRDEYEDHFRLWESLASGALVMTDSMLGLPSSLKHKENIVVYESAEDLEQYLTYYLDPENDKERLKIAKRGWEVVMGQHRSWHRIETIVFGSPLTHVKKPYDDASFLIEEADTKVRL